MKNLKTLIFIVVVILNFFLCLNMKMKMINEPNLINGGKPKKIDLKDELENMSIEELEKLDKTTSETLDEIKELKSMEDSNEDLLKDLDIDDEDLDLFEDDEEDDEEEDENENGGN